MSGGPQGKALDIAVYSVLGLGLLWMGTRVRAANSEVLAVREAAREARDSARVWRIESRVAHKLLYAEQLPDALPAVEVFENEPLQLDLVRPRVFYVVSPTCPACEENFPAMLDVESLFPGHVAVLTSASPDEAARAYQQYKSRLPVYSVPGESLHTVVSGAVTPITMLSVNRRRIQFIYGLVHDNAQATIVRFLASE
jgi:hypothetical protein